MVQTEREQAIMQVPEQALQQLLINNPNLPYRIEGTRLVFEHDVSYPLWSTATIDLLLVSRGIGFWLADALAFGEDMFGEDEAAAVFPIERWAFQTLANAAYTARAVAPPQRHPNLSFAHHAEVAALPPAAQTKMLDLAEEQGWSSADLREQVRAAKRTATRIQAAKAPIPEITIPQLRLELADATRLPLDTESVDLIVTSPPYGLNKPYGQFADEALAWPAFMSDVLRELYRVTRVGGRLALNIPLDTTVGGFRPTYAQAVGLARAAQWQYRFTIDWGEDNVSKSVARGSVDSSSAPHVIARSEMIAVFYKGDDFARPPATRTDDISHEEWLAWTNGSWKIPGESNAWEGHPAAFPGEIPYRLIKLLSYREDTILDPFAGSFTTAVVGLRLGRNVIAFDNDPECVASGKRRLAAVSSSGGLPS